MSGVFNQLKAVLTNPRLCFPDYSTQASHLELHVDASDLGAGTCLSLKQNTTKPIAYISTTSNKTQEIKR